MIVLDKWISCFPSLVPPLSFNNPMELNASVSRQQFRKNEKSLIFCTCLSSAFWGLENRSATFNVREYADGRHGNLDNRQWVNLQQPSHFQFLQNLTVSDSHIFSQNYVMNGLMSPISQNLRRNSQITFLGLAHLLTLF